jgi:ribosomal protein L16 Arg81 hydroxylase
MSSIFSELFVPGDEERFVDHFARKHYLPMRGNPDVISTLVSVDEVNVMLANGALESPRIRVARSGNLVPDVMWSTADGPVDSPALEDMMRKGATLVLDNFGLLVPRLLALEHAVERRLGSSTLINGYLTYERGGAFEAHYDNHDVLIIQVMGEKVWELLSPTERPADSRRGWQHPLKAPETVFWKETLRAGEMLYIPRGMWHRASVDQGAQSFHLSVTIVSLNGHDYARWLIDRIEDDDLVWTDIPRLSGEAGLRQHEAALCARIAEIMAEQGLEAFLSDKDGERVPVSGSRVGKTFAPRDNDLIACALRRRLPSAANQAEAEGRGLELKLSGQSHRLTPAMLALLATVDRATAPVPYAELLGAAADRWPGDNLAQSAKRLFEKGFIRIEPGH